MSDSELEKRVAILEQKCAEFERRLKQLGTGKDWRSTIGMFRDHPGNAYLEPSAS